MFAKSRWILLVLLSLVPNVDAADLTIPSAGRVSIELIASYAAFNNTISVISPPVAIAFSGCQLEPALGLGGVHVVSEETSQRGCRVDLDSDSATPGIQEFAAGTTFEFGMCAQTDSDAQCEYVWSSNPGSNSDSSDHVRTENFATNAWRLSWEDLPNLGDADFNDIIVVFRVQQDSDGDALWDDWETSGIDTNGDGAAEILLAGADPQRKDLYLEVDCLVSDGNGNGSLGDPEDHSHCPPQDSMLDVVAAFANAPVANPDGTTGIQLHIDVGPLYGGGLRSVPGNGGVSGVVGDLGGGNQIDETGNEIIDWDGATGRAGTDFYTLKVANFDNDRRFAYRYAILGHQTNGRRAVNDCTSGWAEDILANDLLVTLGGWRDLNGDGTTDTGCWGMTAANNIDEDADGAVDEDPQDEIDNDGDCAAGTDTNNDGITCGSGDVGVDEDGGFSVGSRGQQAGTLMHEFGHTLNLRHGGGDNVHYKPNYLSVMNYLFQACEVPSSAAGGGAFPGGCAFSAMVLPPTLAGSLDERSLDECLGIDDGSGFFGAMDWNADAVISGGTNCSPPNSTNVQADINFNSSNVDLLDGFEDWANLAYAFQNVGNFVNGVADPVEDEMDPSMLEEIRRVVTMQLAPAVTLTLEAPATALPGETVHLTARVVNSGKGPATQAMATVATPFGDTESFDLDVVKVGEERVTPSVDFAIASDACPQLLQGTASLTFKDYARNAFVLGDVAEVRVLDVTPPVLSVVVTPTQLWPPDHTMADIQATVVVTDECDPNPRVRLLSIWSDEPDNGLGDGDTENDIQNAEYGTDDRTFSLRRERQGWGNGRVYSIVYEASDASGNVVQKTVAVEVPKSMAKSALLRDPEDRKSGSRKGRLQRTTTF